MPEEFQENRWSRRDGRLRLLFFAKFRSHRSKNEKVMTGNLSQLNAPILVTEPP